MKMMMMLMTHTNILSGVNKSGLFRALFRLFRNVPSAWNKVFRLQVIDLHGFLFIIIIIVPLF
jgi:hypothetical protein